MNNFLEEINRNAIIGNFECGTVVQHISILIPIPRQLPIQ